MPRCLLLEPPGFPLHITHHDVAATFLDEEDFTHYRHGDAPREQEIALHANALMINYLHLLLTSPARDRLSAAMRRLGQPCRDFQSQGWAHQRAPEISTSAPTPGLAMLPAAVRIARELTSEFDARECLER